MNAFATHPVVHITGLVLLHFIWQGTIIGIVHAVLLNRLEHASPITRYHLSLGALFLLLVAPLMTLLFYLPGNASGLASHTIIPVDDAIHAVAIPLTAQAIQASPSTSLHSFLPWLVTAWLAGVAACALRFGLGLLSLRRILRKADESTVPAWLRDELDALRTSFGINRRVRLAISNLIDSPLVVGWLVPTILLPVSASTGLGPEQLRMALMHELAHVRRHDYLVNIIQVVLETVLFYHPAVHHVSRNLRREREQCCDDIVAARCSNRVEYARLLAELESLRQQQPALAMSASGSELAMRVNRIVGLPTTSQRRRFNWQFLLPFAIAITLLAVGPDKPQQDQVTRSVRLSLPPAKAQPVPAPIRLAETRSASVIPEIRTETRAEKRNNVEIPNPTASGNDQQEQRSISRSTDAPATSTAGNSSTATKEHSPGNEASTGTAALPEEDAIRIETVPSSAGRTAETTQTEAAAPEPEPVISGGELVEIVEPEYPGTARRYGMEGLVTLRFTVTGEGRVADIEVVEAEPSRIFNTAAIEAVSQWRFTPYREDGQPIAREQLQVVEFKLNGAAADGRSQRECDTTGTRICRPGLSSSNVVSYTSDTGRTRDR